MYETYFELPVYACDQDQLIARVTKSAEKVMADVPDYGNGFWQEQLKNEIETKITPVQYNETIGCIIIHVVGTQLRADYWFTDKSRIVVGSRTKGTIRPVGKLIECHYNSTALSSPEIFSDFRGALEARIAEHSRLKRRYVDYSAFDRCGPYIDWQSILNQ